MSGPKRAEVEAELRRAAECQRSCAAAIGQYERATLDALEGFRQFLVSVEQDRIHRLNESASKPVAEVQYLPYAIALEVREAWGDHLAEAFFATTIQR